MYQIARVSAVSISNALPLGYVATFDHLDVAMKIGGFFVIAAQGVYWGVKAYKEIRKQTRAAKESQNVVAP